MKTIFVIGNGFDLAHELKTSYGHFMKSLSRNQIDNNNLLRILDLNRSSLWSDIEYTYFLLLNNYHDRSFIQKTFNTPFAYDRSKALDDNFTGIKNLLENYLIEEEKKVTLIDSYSNLFQTLDNEDTLILDFNYTNTIKKYILELKSIQHIKIHGELNETENPIIFGFAADNKQSKILSDKNDEYLMKNIKKLCYLILLLDFKNNHSFRLIVSINLLIYK